MIDAEGIKNWAVVGVGIVSTVLINLIMVKQNKKSKDRLLHDQTTFEDEFPFSVPDSIYAEETTPKRVTQNSLGNIINIEPPIISDRRMSGDHAIETGPIKEQVGSTQRAVGWGSPDGKTPSQISNVNRAPVIQPLEPGVSEIRGPEIYPSKEFVRRGSHQEPGTSGTERQNNAMSPTAGPNPKGVHTFTDSSKSSLGSQVTSDISMSMTSVSWVDATVEREPFDFNDEQIARERENPKTYKSA